MHQLENRLIAGQLPGGVGKIVVGDQLAADHLGQVSASSMACTTWWLSWAALNLLFP